MATRNLNKKISETSLRIGEVRFGYVFVFAPRKNDDGTDGKYSVQILIPKTDTVAVQLVKDAIEAAKQAGLSTKFGGKMPSAAKLHTPLRDGDEEFPEDPTYEGMYFLNASSSKDYKPGVAVLANGAVQEALDNEDFYSGCWGCATVNFYAYSTRGNVGIAVGLNNVIKTRDDERLAGGKTAAQDFSDLSDLLGDAMSCLD